VGRPLRCCRARSGRTGVLGRPAACAAAQLWLRAAPGGLRSAPGAAPDGGAARRQGAGAAVAAGCGRGQQRAQAARRGGGPGPVRGPLRTRHWQGALLNKLSYISASNLRYLAHDKQKDDQASRARPSDGTRAAARRMPSAASAGSAEEDRPPPAPRPAARAGAGAAADAGADGSGGTPAPGKRRRLEAAPAAAAAPGAPASTGVAPPSTPDSTCISFDNCMQKCYASLIQCKGHAVRSYKQAYKQAFPQMHGFFFRRGT